MSRRLKFGMAICFTLILVFALFSIANGEESTVIWRFDKKFPNYDTVFGIDTFVKIEEASDLIITVYNSSDSPGPIYYEDFSYYYGIRYPDCWIDPGKSKTIRVRNLDPEDSLLLQFTFYQKEDYPDDTPFRVYGTVSVTKPEYRLSAKSLTLGLGQKKQLKAYLSSGLKVKKWSSSKNTVAKVDKKGKITAVKFGSAKITAKLNNGKKLTCKVTVKPKISKTKATLRYGEKLKLKVSKAGKNPSITWTSSNEAIAKVSSDGTVTAGNKSGKAKITAKIQNAYLSCSVTVKPLVTVKVDYIDEVAIYNDLYVTFHNYSKKKIVYIKLDIKQYNNAGEQLRSPYSSYYLNETIKPGKSLKDWKYWVHDDTKKVTIRIMEVTFSDGTKWRP